MFVKQSKHFIINRQGKVLMHNLKIVIGIVGVMILSGSSYAMTQKAEVVVSSAEQVREEKLAPYLTQLCSVMFLNQYSSLMNISMFVDNLRINVVKETGYSLKEIVNTPVSFLGQRYHLIHAVVIFSSNPELLAFLIDAEADLTIPWVDGLCPLELAIARRKPLFFRMLVPHEKDARKFDFWITEFGVPFLNNTELIKEMMRSSLFKPSSCKSFDKKYPMFNGAKLPKKFEKETVADVVELYQHLQEAVARNVASPVHKRTGNTLLHSLAELGRADLLSQAYDQCGERYGHAYNIDGFMPIHVAVMAAIADVNRYGAVHPGLVRTIVVLTNKDRQALQARTETGFTPLQLAARYQCAPVMRLLVEMGARDCGDVVITQVRVPFSGREQTVKVSLHDELVSSGLLSDFNGWVAEHARRVGQEQNLMLAAETSGRISVENEEENVFDALHEAMGLDRAQAELRQRQREHKELQVQEAKALAAEEKSAVTSHVSEATLRRLAEADERIKEAAIRKELSGQAKKKQQKRAREEAQRAKFKAAQEEFAALPAAEERRRRTVADNEQQLRAALVSMREASLESIRKSTAERLRKEEVAKALKSRPPMQMVVRQQAVPVPKTAEREVEQALDALVLDAPEKDEFSEQALLEKQAAVINLLNTLAIDSVEQALADLGDLLAGIDSAALRHALLTEAITFTYVTYDDDGNELPGTMACTLAEYYDSWDCKIEDEASRGARDAIKQLLQGS